ncbi:MAG: Uma2 family endonuclease [Bryobacteraceae bacterium]
MSPEVALRRIAVEEYLATSFEDGDREYVDGVVVERNMGEKDHSRLQRRLIVLLDKIADVYCFPEQRVQVKANRFRVPDVCACVGVEPEEQVFTTPPFLAIEILSRTDRASDVEEKIDDYLSFGVPFVWVIDPRLKLGYVYTSGGRETCSDSLSTVGPEIRVRLADLFA